MLFITKLILLGLVFPFYPFVDIGINSKLTCKNKIRYYFPSQDLKIPTDKNSERDMAQKLYFGVVENFVEMVIGKIFKK